MIAITLPDGSRREFEHPVSVAEVAASIGAGLAKAALAGKVDGKLVDTSFRIDHDAKLEIVTEKSPDALDILRHSTAHLLAQATQRLFPDTQVTIGPVVENGFYYDFARKTPFTPEDLDKIETEMKKIVAEALPVQRSVMAKDDAIRFFNDKGEKYKAQIIDEIIPPGEEISLYGQGEWIDLCRGPHVPNTNKLRAFKLMKVAGAYWRGDAKNEMLQRVYGTAWLNDKDLKSYLTQLEEAEKSEALWAAINRLPKERRDLLLYKFSSRLSNLEIGEMMNKSESAIKSLYFRTLGTLRKDLESRGWGAWMAGAEADEAGDSSE